MVVENSWSVEAAGSCEEGVKGCQAVCGSIYRVSLRILKPIERARYGVVVYVGDERRKVGGCNRLQSR